MPLFTEHQRAQGPISDVCVLAPGTHPWAVAASEQMRAAPLVRAEGLIVPTQVSPWQPVPIMWPHGSPCLHTWGGLGCLRNPLSTLRVPFEYFFENPGCPSEYS